MKPDIEETKTLTRNIDGWLHDSEGELLYSTARNCSGKGVIVEIGSWKGKSTSWIGRGAKNGKCTRIYAIDPHIGSNEHQANGKVWTFEEFKRNIRATGVDDIVIPWVKTSEEAAKEFPEPVEFVFIDGAHEYESVKQDFDLWFPKLVDGGLMAFHDTIVWPGPKKVVRENVALSRRFKNLRFVHSTTVAQKTTQNSSMDQLRNKYALFLKDAYEIMHKMNPPKAVRKLLIRLFSLVH